MLHKMPVKVGLLTEAAFADVALEGFLFVVDVANVSLQVTRDGERSFAVLAFVRLLSGVSAKVPRKIC